jgi:hypothetical protein
MTTIKLVSAGLIATVMLSAPAMACKHFSARRHVAKKTNTSASPIAIDSYARIPAPWPSPFRPPPDEDNCDVGDNPFVC